VAFAAMRFVSLNLRAYFGRGGLQIQDLAELIALHRPDVVLLQEARPGWLGVVCSTAGLTGAYSLDVDPRLPGRRGDGCAIGVRSPLWIERTWRVAPGGFGPAVVGAVIDESVPAGYERLPGALAARFSTRTLLARICGGERPFVAAAFHATPGTGRVDGQLVSEWKPFSMAAWRSRSHRSSCRLCVRSMPTSLGLNQLTASASIGPTDARDRESSPHC
jgi:hypothetical protein